MDYALFKKIPALLCTHFIVVENIGSQCETECQASCNRGKKLDKSQFILSTESTTDRRTPPPPPPRLLPFSTDRLGAWALSQRYQSIRSYPQLPTLIGGQLPKGQEAWIIAQLWGAFFCLQIHMLWLKSLCSAINDSLSSDCHSSVTALWRSE